MLDNESSFGYIDANVEEIIPILSQYKIYDLVRAIYCLNAWRPNRSALAQCFAMNKALCTCKEFGSKRIETYCELEAFYHVIIQHHVLSDWDDVIIDDFGEIFINYQTKTYPVIAGTGHQMVYPAIRFIPYVCEHMGRQEEFLVLLSYLEHTITTLGSSNKTHGDEIVYELPSSEFWRDVKALLESTKFRQLIDGVCSAMGKYSNQIESTYCFEWNDNIYPLWNPGLLIDFYHSMNPDTTKYPRQSLLHFINDMYCQIDSQPKELVLLEPIVLDMVNHSVDQSYNILLLAVAEHSALVFIDNIGSTNAEDRIHRLNQIHKGETIHFVESMCRDARKGNRGYSLAPECDIYYVIVHAYSDINLPFALTRSRKEHCHCTYLDVFCYFGFASVGEIIAFYKYKEKANYGLISIGSDSNEFFAWKKANYHIVTGAVELNTIYVEYNVTELYIYDYFRDNLVNFPYCNIEYFSEPLAWDFHDCFLDYSDVGRKGYPLLNGYLKRLTPDISVFISRSYQFFELNNSIQKMETAQDTLIELCQRLLARYADWLESVKGFHGKVLHFLFVPEAHFSDNSKFPNKIQGKIASCSVSCGKTIISIRYSIHIDQLFTSLRMAKNRAYENQFFLDLMTPFQSVYPKQYKDLLVILHKDVEKKKTVSVSEFEQRYVYSPFSIQERIENSSLILARKQIAVICKEKGILPGEYHGKDVTCVIRKIQLDLVRYYEEMIARFDQLELHCRTLDYYAYQVNEVYIQKQRYFSLSDLDDEIREEFCQNVIKNRENNRRNKLTVEYLLETNLYVKHDDAAVSISDKEFNYLLAFSDWLCTLQEISDICYFRSDDSFITVNEQYIIDTHKENDEIKMKYNQGIARKYSVMDYGPKFDEEDNKYINRIKEAFFSDTGICFELLLSLLEYMSLDMIFELKPKEIHTNVYSIPKKEIISNFKHSLIDNSISNEQIEETLNFCILNPALLKTYKSNKTSDILPTWERESRENRFEVKPIFLNQNSCIFSPVIIYQLLDLWKNGLLNWFPPYEIGLPNLKNSLSDWKKHYEDLMVQDIKSLFEKAHFDIVLPNMELCSRFPRDAFPENLGDFDVFCVNEASTEIWLIESKVFHKVGSIFEDLKLQESVFYQNKYDEKFQRRIAYIKNNLDKITKVFKLQNSTYRIIPYMVTNKLFYSRYKALSFDIITFSELQARLNSSRG